MRADLVLADVATSGALTQNIALPNNLALTGQELFTQCLVLDSAAPNGFGAMSNAVHAVLGQ